MFAPITISSNLHGVHTYAEQEGKIVMDGKTVIASLSYIKNQAHFDKTCRRHWAAYTAKLRSIK